MAKVQSKQGGKQAVDRQEDEPGPLLPASIEMLPSDDARQSRHELGCFPEIGETQCSPMRSEQGEADEFARFSGRQAEDRRKLRGTASARPRLYRRATAKELEPPGVHAMHCLRVPAKRGLVDEPLRAIEPPPTDLRGEMPLEMTLDRSNQVRHYATSCSSSGFGRSVRW
jgi:hypothetical protein